MSGRGICGHGLFVGVAPTTLNWEKGRGQARVRHCPCVEGTDGNAQGAIFVCRSGTSGGTLGVTKAACPDDPRVPLSPCPLPVSLCPRVQELCLLLPGARRMNRGRAELGALVGACRAAGVTDLLVLHETRGRPGQWGRGLLGGPLGWGYGVATLPSRLGSLSLPSIPI